MKKVLFLLITLFLIGCSVPTQEMEKDKAFLRNQGLTYDHVVLNWSEPDDVRYLTTHKFIAVWDKGSLGSGYRVRVLFDRTKVVNWKIEEINIDKTLATGISMSD
jgi:hypothetical protein